MKTKIRSLGQASDSGCSIWVPLTTLPLDMGRAGAPDRGANLLGALGADGIRHRSCVLSAMLGLCLDTMEQELRDRRPGRGGRFVRSGSWLGAASLAALRSHRGKLLA